MIGGAAVALSGCVATSAEPRLGSDGKPLPQVYVISGAEAAKIPYRLLDAVNALRQANTNQIGEEGWFREEVHDALDLCDGLAEP